jgi:hypothetical protein
VKTECEPPVWWHGEDLDSLGLTPAQVSAAYVADKLATATKKPPIVTPVNIANVLYLNVGGASQWHWRMARLQGIAPLDDGYVTAPPDATAHTYLGRVVLVGTGKKARQYVMLGESVERQVRWLDPNAERPPAGWKPHEMARLPEAEERPPELQMLALIDPDASPTPPTPSASNELAAVIRASLFSRGETSVNFWERLAVMGASDEGILMALRDEWLTPRSGDEGGGWHACGGESPWLCQGKESSSQNWSGTELLWSGSELLATIRQVMRIGQRQPGEMFAAEKTASAIEGGM